MTFMKKIKVFISSAIGAYADRSLTDECNLFLENGEYQLVDMHSSCSEKGYMLVITYLDNTKDKEG